MTTSSAIEVLLALIFVFVMSTLAWLTAKLAGTAPPDPEAERARERNRLRDLGEEMRAERKKHTEKRAEHERVYRAMLAASKGDTRSGFYKRAVAAKRQMAECDRDIRSIDSRLVPLEQTLRAATNRHRDSEYNKLMSNLVTAEENAPNAPDRAQIGQVMSRANKLVRDTDGLERDLDALDMNPVEDMNELDSEMAADYQAMLAGEMASLASTTSPAVHSTPELASSAPGGSSSSSSRNNNNNNNNNHHGVASYGPSEEERVAALEAAIRNPPPAWTPPPGFNYATQ